MTSNDHKDYIAVNILNIGFYLFLGHELVISHKPSYVRLDEKSDSIRVTDIQYALSAVHGFTLHKVCHFPTCIHANHVFLF